MKLAENTVIHTTAVDAVEQELVTSEQHEVASEDTGLLGSLGINVSGIAAQFFNFALVSVIVWFLILRPLTKKMEERRKLIDESLDRAKEIETNHKMSEIKFQEKLDQAKKEANEIIATAQKNASELADQSVQKSKEKIEELVTQAKKNIEIEKQEMRESVRKETVEIVVSAMEKILNEKMDDKKDKKFVEDILKTIE